ncbi:hypothetical protein B0J13DRAFT_561791 [Dactylonectria estremocensis]|uniref:Uncharacterized protein n=1 Tax=Dactylonectria estremocensis TaxID=1079267 RepID=A0A9P9IUV4_9HYPO|nr:hypothetical protein B0J13DRAFT_561791 [Dactylonectria estremocensis]
MASSIQSITLVSCCVATRITVVLHSIEGQTLHVAGPTALSHERLNRKNTINPPSYSEIDEVYCNCNCVCICICKRPCGVTTNT